MQPIVNHCTHLKKGFLLIELLTALAILSVLLLVITTQIWQCICWQQETQLRLDALHAATATLEQAQITRKITKTSTTKNGITVTIEPVDIRIAQKKIDTVIPIITQKMVGLEKEKFKKQTFKPISVVSEWESPSGKKRRLQLLTGVLIS